MVFQTFLKVLLVAALFYAGWYVFSFVFAWAGVAIILLTLVGVGMYAEKEIKKHLK